VDSATPQYTLQQLENLQQLFQDLERTQNATGMQTDQAKKLCRLSLDMDIAQRNHELELYAKLMNAYTALVKVAEFTPKSSQSSSSFESVGELVAFLEKTGFINKFYDGEDRDIVDKTIKSQQIFLRRIVSGESNLSERIEQRLQRMQVLDRMEDGTTSEEEWSYDLQKDEDWIEDGNYEDYSDPDEQEELEVDE
jgi:small-conductance mechanosensitive channel